MGKGSRSAVTRGVFILRYNRYGTDIGIDETRQMDPFRQGEVRVRSVIPDELLLVADVRCVDPRVPVILAKYGHTGLERKRTGGQEWNGSDPRIRGSGPTSRVLLTNASYREQANPGRNFLLLAPFCS